MKIKSFQIREITDFNWKKIEFSEDVGIFIVLAIQQVKRL